MARKHSQNIEDRYSSGWLPIGDTKWIVETLRKDKFVKIGEITVKGSDVSAEMDAHRSIKGYEPMDIAKKRAHEKFPRANPIIVTPTK